MTAMQQGPTTDVAWRRPLVIAAGCVAIGLVARLMSFVIPVQVGAACLGVGLIGAAFMLAWAADAGDHIFSGGLVLAAVALATVLPEFIIEVRFAFIQAVELVTANLTGATRLLLTGALAVPLVVAVLARRYGQLVDQPLELAPDRRLEIGVLLLTSLFAVSIAVRGSLTVVDGLLLIALYVYYARRVQGTPGEEAAVVGVASGLLSLPARYQRAAITGLIAVGGAAVVVIANPFADALLEIGTSVGIDPYLLIQSVVPAATEAPEFVVVAVLVANQRPAHGLALFLASSVSQWTLGMGSLPIAYWAGGGGMSMPLAPREQLEVAFTIAVTLFIVAALATLRPERVDALLTVSVFFVQMVYPTPFVRLAASVLLLFFAIDLLLSRRRSIRPILRAAFGRSRAQG